MPVGNLRRVHFHRLAVLDERNLILLRRRHKFCLFDIRILTTHSALLLLRLASSLYSALAKIKSRTKI